MNYQIIENRRKELAKALEVNRDLLQVLNEKEREEFRSAFLEFATQDYLVSVIEPREIIRFAVKIAKIGLNINPAYKEVYIVPFDTKVSAPGKREKVKVMLPQAIIPLNGIQEIAFRAGFFLRLYEVYKIDDDYVAENEMNRAQQAKLRTADAKWVEENFIGFDVVLQDLSQEIPEQRKFVEASYVKEVTKTLRDERFKIQSWRHKAVRRAFGDFFIPRSRRIDLFDKLEQINDEFLNNGSNSSQDKTFLTPQIENAVTQLGLQLRKQNGIATVEGNTFAHSKTLKELGFTFTDGSWQIHCKEPALVACEVEVVKPSSEQSNQSQDTKESSTKTSPTLFDQSPMQSLEELRQRIAYMGLRLSEPKPNKKGQHFVLVEGDTTEKEEQLLALGFKKHKNGYVRQVDDLMEESIPF